MSSREVVRLEGCNEIFADEGFYTEQKFKRMLSNEESLHSVSAECDCDLFHKSLKYAC